MRVALMTTDGFNCKDNGKEKNNQINKFEKISKYGLKIIIKANT